MEIQTLEQAVEVIKQQQSLIEKLKERVQYLENQLRKYRNPNTPSGSLPPYLKDELRKITSISEKEPESKQAKPNQRNRRQKPDRLEVHQLKECPYCHSAKLKEHKKRTRRTILHLQFPEVKNILHEAVGYTCEGCGREVQAPIPDTLPNSKFDLNISLMIVLFNVLGMTQSKIAIMLGWFGVDLCPASVNNAIHRVQRYLGDKRYRQLEEELRSAIAAGADETSWRHRGKTYWMFAVTTAKTIFFRIEKGRGQKYADKLPSRNAITCDGYRAYDKLSKQQQRCWAHLMRMLRDPALTFNEDWEVKQFVKFVRRLSKLYKKAKNEKRRGNRVKRIYEKKLDRILRSKYKHEENLSKAMNYIVRYYDDWFTFLKRWGIEPTNNRTERALRPMVIQRKVSQHSQSDEGRDGLAIRQTIYQTSRLRGEDFAQILRHDVEEGLHERGKI
jgi:transposase